METIVEKNKCTGCTACMNICPKNAISMEIDNEGFKHPVINKDKCIDCGLCKKTCPVLNTTSNKSLNKCYVAYNKDEVSCKNKASSGSIFELIAKLILNENGIVIGAAFDENNKLNHIAIDNIKDLDKLKGSKYLQSHLNNIFTYIKENIKNKKILFVGTPCQVAGLKSFIKNDFNNLICLDLVCHGVPSPKLFEKYIKEIEDKYNSQIVDYNFRDKKTGWDTYSNTITFKNQKEITQLQKDNKYMKLFLSDIALRESCYNCNFKLGNKYSDITLGDFWGVNNYYPDMYNKTGVSAIIINTENYTVMDKKFYTAFNDQLIHYIMNNHIDKIYLCGLETECCVLKTALDLFENEYEVYVLEKYCACTHGKERHDNAIKILSTTIGRNSIIM